MAPGAQVVCCALPQMRGGKTWRYMTTHCQSFVELP
jgi:hypothetical protein